VEKNTVFLPKDLKAQRRFSNPMHGAKDLFMHNADGNIHGFPQAG
jgi:hypothetical protein